MPHYAVLVRTLVYAGALPFMGSALLVLLPLLPALDASGLFQRYLLVILTFLCGVHWGQGLAARGQLPVNVFLLSNALVVLLWLAEFFLPLRWFLLLALVVLGLLVWIDRTLHAVEAIDHWYYLTRQRISWIVGSCVAMVLLA